MMTTSMAPTHISQQQPSQQQQHMQQQYMQVSSDVNSFSFFRISFLFNDHFFLLLYFCLLSSSHTFVVFILFTTFNSFPLEYAQRVKSRDKHKENSNDISYCDAASCQQQRQAAASTSMLPRDKLNSRIRTFSQMPQQQVQQVPQQSQQHHQQQQQPSQQQQQQQQMIHSNPTKSDSLSNSPPAVNSVTQAANMAGQRPTSNACIRHGCPNPAVANSEWEDEYCSNECVVSHCRDVFTTWVSSNQNPQQNFSTVK